MAYLKVTDYFKVRLPDVDVVRDSKTGKVGGFNLQEWLRNNQNDLNHAKDDASLQTGLQITAEATASDVLINGRCYMGKSVRKAHGTFKQKPILTHHNDYSDAIGRISASKFEQLLSGADFDNAYLNPAIQKTDKVIGTPSGRVIVKANIFDALAIEKVKDSRYLHMSQGGRASSVKCSVCNKDWLKDGPCEHERGKYYATDEKKTKLMYLILEMETYDELSFVNTPAWSKAQVLTMDSEEELENYKKKNIDLSKLNDKLLESLEENWSIVQSNSVTLTDALGNELVAVRDEKEHDKIVIDQILFSDGKEETTEDGENMTLEELKAELATVKEQLKTTTDSLATANKEKETLAASVSTLKAEVTTLSTKLEETSKDQIQQDASFVVLVRELTGKESFKDAEERKKKVEEFASKGAHQLKGIKDYVLPDYYAAVDKLVAKKEDKPKDEVEKDKVGKSQSTQPTNDKPKVVDISDFSL